MEPFSFPSCMMTQHTPIFPAGCSSWPRKGLIWPPPKPFGPQMSPSAPRVLPDPLGHPGLNPEAEQQCLGVPWHKYEFIFVVSQRTEGRTLPNFTHLEVKKEKAAAASTAMGTVQPGMPRVFHFPELCNDILYTTALLSFSCNCSGFQVGTLGLESDIQNMRNT